MGARLKGGIMNKVITRHLEHSYFLYLGICLKFILLLFPLLFLQMTAASSAICATTAVFFAIRATTVASSAICATYCCFLCYLCNLLPLLFVQITAASSAICATTTTSFAICAN